MMNDIEYGVSFDIDTKEHDAEIRDNTRIEILEEIKTQITILKNAECKNCECADIQENCPYVQALNDMEDYLDKLKEVKHEPRKEEA